MSNTHRDRNPNAKAVSFSRALSILPDVPRTSGLRTADIGRHSSQPRSYPRDAITATASTILGRDKVAISRFVEQTTSVNRNKTSNRVSRACARCRKSKTKCSGGEPCRACEQENQECLYPSGKVELQKRHFDNLERQNTVFRNLLVSLKDSNGIQLSERLQIRDALDNEATFQEDLTSNLALPSLALANAGVGYGSEESYGFSQLSHVSLSPANSFVYTTTSSPEVVPGSLMPNMLDIIGSNHNLRRTTTIDSDTPDDCQYEWPGSTIANELLMTYMSKIHPTFPVIDATLLYTAIEYLSDMRLKDDSKPSQRYISIAYMVMALASHHNKITNVVYDPFLINHDLYFCQSQPIIARDWDPFDSPDLDIIVFLGLVELYSIKTGMIKKAWIVHGISVHYAIGMRLHLRDTMPENGDSDGDYRRRVWWSLYVLECHLSAVTRLPGCIRPGEFTTDFAVHSSDQTGPVLPVSERAKSRSPMQLDMQLLFKDTICLQEGTVDPGGIKEFQRFALQHEAKLQQWTQTIPPDLSYTHESSEEQEILRRVGLAMAYHSTRMTLYQRRSMSVECGSKSPDTCSADQESGDKCTESARAVADLLSQLPRKSCFYELPATWTAMHALTQAGESLLLDLVGLRQKSAGGVFTVTHRAALTIVLEWLEFAAETSPSAGSLSINLRKELNLCGGGLGKPADGRQT